MKKLLLASTALVASAGFAAADVSLSGYAEMGVAGGGAKETQLHNDIDVTFKLSGETDAGLSFGATIDLDEITNAGDDDGIPHTANDSSVFISGGFGTLTLGDTDGAHDWAMAEVGAGTSLTDDHTAHAGFNGNSGLDGDYDGQILRWDYAAGAFGVAVSAEMDDDGNFDPILGLGVKYSMDLASGSLGLGLGFQSGDDSSGNPDSVMGLSVSAGLGGGFKAGFNYSTTDYGTDDDETHYALGLTYQVDALMLHANYGSYQDKGGVADADVDGYGLAVNYDLGGGAVVMLGYGDGDNSDSTWSFGLGLSF